ncbi:hypothetical protein GGQ99_004801 [Aminobacter niigataensis]|uniref:Uncharacterized protein n=1 Tax=Aminobacter niigataensis TaxID=83265 RepID=A0ABR6L891_9HYPH|nr:hypothetical protein [Aminobacter niigataensis]MBB4653017.1 hypothetical protein [Aminobacter niigataensis]
MIEHLDHFDLPGREPEAGQPLECIDLGIGEEGGTEAVGASAIGQAVEAAPEVDEAPRQRRKVELGLELLSALRGPGSIEETLDVIPRRDPVGVRRGKCEICLGVSL